MSKKRTIANYWKKHNADGKPRIRRTYCYEVWLHDNYASDETYHSVYSDQATAEHVAHLLT